jgi:hypothetical protein
LSSKDPLVMELSITILQFVKMLTAVTISSQHSTPIQQIHRKSVSKFTMMMRTLMLLN